jgi:hypothetical protein
MLRFALLLFALLGPRLACATPALDITLAHGTTAEQKTKVQLQRLLGKYNVSKWVFTRKISIEGGQIPHSDPVLTLNTRHLDRNDLLLSTFIHEQLHWFLASREDATAAVVAELRTMYPQIPLGFPQGSGDEEGNYHHMIVTYLEYQAGKSLLGPAQARKVIDFWSGDHYTWIYKKMLADEARLGAVLRKHGLVI